MKAHFLKIELATNLVSSWIIWYNKQPEVSQKLAIPYEPYFFKDEGAAVLMEELHLADIWFQQNSVPFSTQNNGPF